MIKMVIYTTCKHTFFAFVFAFVSWRKYSVAATNRVTERLVGDS